MKKGELRELYQMMFPEYPDIVTVKELHKEEIHVEICSKCHPFYTGQQKASSTRGRIDKFNKKYGVSNN